MKIISVVDDDFKYDNKGILVDKKWQQFNDELTLEKLFPLITAG